MTSHIVLWEMLLPVYAASLTHTHTREQLWTWGTGGVSRHLLHTLTACSLAFTQGVSADSSQSPFPSVGHLYIVPHRLAMAQENRSVWATACRSSRYTSPRYSTRQNCKDRLTTTTTLLHNPWLEERLLVHTCFLSKNIKISVYAEDKWHKSFVKYN